MKTKDILLNGILQNPVFVLALGLCPVLATTTTLSTAIYMGLATFFVLLSSNVIVSLIKKLIPDSVRIPAYILIVATFVTIVQILMRRYLPDVSLALGNYLALIVVNCLILGRIEAFARKSTVWHSFVDAVSMGLGFIFAIAMLGLFREVLGANSLTIFGVDGINQTVLGGWFTPISIFVQPAGGFLMLGFLTAGFNAIFMYFGNKIENKNLKNKIKANQTSQVQKTNEKTQQVEATSKEANNE